MAVVALLGSGLLPVALEMVDRGLLAAIEAAFGLAQIGVGDADL